MGWMFQTFAKQKSDLVDTLVLGAQYCRNGWGFLTIRLSSEIPLSVHEPRLGF
jgi:hypothetical protein